LSPSETQPTLKPTTFCPRFRQQHGWGSAVLASQNGVEFTNRGLTEKNAIVDGKCTTQSSSRNHKKVVSHVLIEVTDETWFSTWPSNHREKWYVQSWYLHNSTGVTTRSNFNIFSSVTVYNNGLTHHQT
jgi:hypothetical protein